MTEKDDPKAQQRMQVILEHLAGRLTATQAAEGLRLSRKTFYEWLERARMGMFLALRDRPTGRPPEAVDLEKERLREELETLEKDRAVLTARLRIQEAIRQTLEADALSPPKKKRQEP